MSLSGEVAVDDKVLFTWSAEWLRSEQDEEVETVWRHTYACVITYDDEERVEWEATQHMSDNAEMLAAKVMLKAAWHRRAKDRPKGKRR